MGAPNSSKPSRASKREEAVVALIYSRKIGNVRHNAYALNARIISTSASFATWAMRFRFSSEPFPLPAHTFGRESSAYVMIDYFMVQYKEKFAVMGNNLYLCNTNKLKA